MVPYACYQGYIGHSRIGIICKVLLTALVLCKKMLVPELEKESCLYVHFWVLLCLQLQSSENYSLQQKAKLDSCYGTDRRTSVREQKIAKIGKSFAELGTGS